MLSSLITRSYFFCETLSKNDQVGTHQLTELNWFLSGEYAMLEHSAKPGVVESLKIITQENTFRFAEWCFKLALQEKRKKVTIVHKANIM